MGSLLSVRDLVKIYRLGRVDVIALRGISFDVWEGEILAVTGASGCGKTTLINVVGGVEPSSAGSVVMADRDIGRLKGPDLVEFRRHGVGIVFQFFSLIPYLSALQNVELPMRLDGKAPDESSQRAASLLSAVGLGERASHKPSELSGGEQQRVAIAAALANDPPLILADEPTGELDTLAGERIIQLFCSLREEFGKTIVIASHEERVIAIADRVLSMKDGEILHIHGHSPRPIHSPGHGRSRGQIDQSGSAASLEGCDDIEEAH